MCGMRSGSKPTSRYGANTGSNPVDTVCSGRNSRTLPLHPRFQRVVHEQVFVCLNKEGFPSRPNMAIIAIKELNVRSVNVAELKNQLSKYLTFAKGGEEIVIRDRNLPVAKLVPFSSGEASEEELLLVAAGKMRMPQSALNVDELLKIRTGRVPRNEGVQALLDDRAESL
ncbi:MAG: hypothetical protein DMG69_26505 [Acidobacteria bacterium]|nr:MAG: hypothetical protein DMG69_26505 [Acidobacteriota bacterium]